MDLSAARNLVTNEEQRKVAQALSAPSGLTEVPSIRERLKRLEDQGLLTEGQAERVYQEAKLGLEEQEQRAHAQERDKSQMHLQGITTWRRRFGYVLMAISGVSIPVVFFLSTAGLHKLTELPRDFPADRFWLLAAGHAVVTFVTLFFLYQVLKAAERMAMPYWWAERHPETVRLMLGVEDLVTVGSRSAEQMAKSAAPLVEPVSKLIDAATRRLEVLLDKQK